MRVGCNVEQIVQDGVSGIASYTAQLVRRLPRLGCDVTAFTARHSPSTVAAALAAAGVTGVDPVILPLPRPVLYDAWHTVGLGGPARRIAPVDLIHAPSVAVPPVGRLPLVVTAHDAAPVTWPETYTRRGRWFHRRGLRAAARRARLVIAVSEFSADELAEHTEIPRERIRVVPNGVELARAGAEEVAAVRARFALGDRPYVMWVGTFQPRKNLPVLVDAFTRLESDALPHTLVLVGSPGWLDGAESPQQALGDRVRLTGPVAGSELSALYAGADLFAFPSLHEGFGLPALEAMAQGTPVLASDIPALREVGGDAAQFVPASDVDAWHGALTALLGDADTRAELVTRGLTRVEQFSWDRCATRTLEVYEEALA